MLDDHLVWTVSLEQQLSIAFVNFVSHFARLGSFSIEVLQRKACRTRSSHLLVHQLRDLVLNLLGAEVTSRSDPLSQALHAHKQHDADAHRNGRVSIPLDLALLEGADEFAALQDARGQLVLDHVVHALEHAATSLPVLTGGVSHALAELGEGLNAAHPLIVDLLGSVEEEAELLDAVNVAKLQ